MNFTSREKSEIAEPLVVAPLLNQSKFEGNQMLVLSRKVHETICLGNDIKITVVRVSGGSVRIGIDAPKSLNVFRGEAIDGAKNETDAEESNSHGSCLQERSNE